MLQIVVEIQIIVQIVIFFASLQTYLAHPCIVSGSKQYHGYPPRDDYQPVGYQDLNNGFTSPLSARNASFTTQSYYRGRGQSCLPRFLLPADENFGLNKK